MAADPEFACTVCGAGLAIWSYEGDPRLLRCDDCVRTERLVIDLRTPSATPQVQTV